MCDECHTLLAQLAFNLKIVAQILSEIVRISIA